MTQHIAMIEQINQQREEIKKLKHERNLLRTRIEVMVDAWPEYDDDDSSIGGADMVEWFAEERVKCQDVLARTTLENVEE